MNDRLAGHDANAINRLIGRFLDLQERWESAPDSFDWSLLHTLAQDGAQAYNEGAGPSFHALALDGMQHTPFHERFLDASLEAGFDPFKLASVGNSAPPIPVIDHSGFAEDASRNSSSARMRATLMDLARARYEPLVQEMEKTQAEPPGWLLETAAACGESFPADLLQRISPALLNSAGNHRSIRPAESHSSTIETITDQRHPS